MQIENEINGSEEQTEIPSTVEFLFGDAPEIETTPQTETGVETTPTVETPPVVQIKSDPTPTASVVAPEVPLLDLTEVVPPVVETPVVQQQQAPVAPAREISPEEVHKSLNVYNMTESDYASVFEVDSKEESIKNLNGILQKVVRQAVTMAHTLAEQKTTELMQQVQPYMQFADQQRFSGVEQALYQNNPELKGSEPLVEAVVKAFVSKGAKFATPQELFSAITTNVNAYKQRLGGQTTNPVASAPARTPAVKPRMVSLSNGGQGGSAPSGGSGSGRNMVETLFG